VGARKRIRFVTVLTVLFYKKPLKRLLSAN